MPGGRIDIEVVPDVRGFPGKLATGLKGIQGVASTVGKGIGVAIAAGTAVAAVGLKHAIQIGIEYQSKLNELQAVSGATALQMAQVGQKAKALGSDLTLPATSAAGAAAAMLELAKGGLSVEQSMTAARGTLQLAAAAQVEAATAAEIQSNALNQFGLAADQAGKVADVLANTANAASGGILDIANALKYVGPIARSVGVPITDTAAAIGLLANNGIQSEQAGTSLRSMLASLASPSKQAAKAMKALSLEAFDQNGKFVGLRSIVEQLAAAKKRLTDQTFQEAAANAFGNEALSAINALANEGAASFDEMATAVGRAGGASEVAAAKMRGLGGAWEGFKSQLETAGIEIFETIDGPLEAVVRKAADVVQDLTPAVKRGLDGAVAAGSLFGPELGRALASRADSIRDAGARLLGPLGEGLKNALNSGLEIAVETLQDFGDVVRKSVDVVEPLAIGIGEVIQSFDRGDGPIAAFGAALGIAYDAAKIALGILAPAVEIVGDLVGAFADLPGPIQTAALALLALNFGPSVLGGLRGALSGAGNDAEQAAQKTGLFGRTVGLVAAPVRIAASGLSSAAGTVRQFAGEMALQRSLAAASGQSMLGLSGAVAAYRTSTIPAVETTRRFTDQLAGVRAGAAAVEQPISRVGAAIGVIVERSPALSAMRDTYQRTFSTLSQASERAALSAGIATESIGTRLQTAVIRTGLEVENAGSKFAGFGNAIRSGFSSAVDAVATKTSNMMSAIQAIPTGVGVAAISMQDKLVGAANRVGEAFTNLPGRIAAFPTAIGVGVIGTLERIPGAVTSAVDAVGRFGAAAGATAAALGRGLVSAATGLIGALGGPFGIAIAAASVGLGLLAGRQKEAEQRTKEHKDRVSSLAEALRETNGAINESIRVKAASALQSTKLADSEKDVLTAARELGVNLDQVTEGYLGNADAQAAVNAALDQIIANSKEYDTSTGTTIESLNSEGKAAVALKAALDGTNKTHAEAIQKNKDLDNAIANGTASMLDATESGRTFAGAMKTLSDRTATADDKARALKNALDALSGGQVGLDEALANVNEQFDRLNDHFTTNGTEAEIAALKAKGFGDALLTSSGRINTATENGRKLRDSLEEITSSTVNVAQRTFDMTGSLEEAKKVVQENRDRFVAMAEKMGISREAAAKLADQMGLIPERVVTVIETPGMSNAQKELLVFQATLARTPPGKDVIINSLTDEAKRKLEEFGFKVTNLPDGKIAVRAETASAQDNLDRFINNNSNRSIIVRARILGVNQATLRQEALGQKFGGLVHAFAAGGFERKLTPMKGGVASIVGPNTWRVIGDRIRGDEAYIPIEQTDRSFRILRETADRMGFALLRRYATGGVAVAGTQSTATVPRSAPVGGDTFVIGQADDPYRVAEAVQRVRDFRARTR